MHFINARASECLYSPIRSLLPRRRAGHATADDIGQMTEIVFKWRSSQHTLDDVRRDFGARFVYTASGLSLWHLWLEGFLRGRKLCKGECRKGAELENQSGCQNVRFQLHATISPCVLILRLNSILNSVTMPLKWTREPHNFFFHLEPPAASPQYSLFAPFRQHRGRGRYALLRGCSRSQSQQCPRAVGPPGHRPMRAR